MVRSVARNSLLKQIDNHNSNEKSYSREGTGENEDGDLEIRCQGLLDTKAWEQMKRLSGRKLVVQGFIHVSIYPSIHSFIQPASQEATKPYHCHLSAHGEIPFYILEAPHTP